jgi:hypothetical protein
MWKTSRNVVVVAMVQSSGRAIQYPSVVECAGLHATTIRLAIAVTTSIDLGEFDVHRSQVDAPIFIK